MRSGTLSVLVTMHSINDRITALHGLHFCSTLQYGVSISVQFEMSSGFGIRSGFNTERRPKQSNQLPGEKTHPKTSFISCPWHSDGTNPSKSDGICPFEG